jgi:hypothetical protein
MNFEESEKIDVTKHMEKKGKFTYLSWPFAVSEFRKNYPNGVWDVEQFGENNQPYCQSDAGCFVQVEVVPDIDKPDQTFTQIHPVLDYSNKPVKEPSAFQVNTSIQRCLVKAIALATGIGLHIYAGEDLPPGEDKPEYDKELLGNMLKEMSKCTNNAALDKWIAANKENAAKLNDRDKAKLNSNVVQQQDIYKKEEKDEQND